MENLDLRYIQGPYAQQIATQLWADITNDYGCGYWWDRPLCPVYAPRPARKNPRVTVQCGRCCGKGAIESFTLSYNGKCFACNGSGVRYISQAAFRRLQEKAAA